MKEIKIMFGGGAQGKIMEKGKMDGPNTPQLMNVYYV